jgi:hypothetical protein
MKESIDSYVVPRLQGMENEMAVEAIKKFFLS